MHEYNIKPGKIGKKVISAYKTVETKFVDAFLEEDGSMKTHGMSKKASDAYKKVEDTVVGGYKKIEDAFLEAFLETPEGEKNTDSDSNRKG